MTGVKWNRIGGGRILALAMVLIMVAAVFPARPLAKNTAVSEDLPESARVLSLLFDDESVTDGTGKHSPVLSGGAPAFIEGAGGQGKALEFNGAVIDLGTPDLIQSPEFTLSFRAKAPAGGYVGEQVLIWAKPQSSWNSGGWYLTLNYDGAVNLMVGPSFRAATTAPAAEFFPENQWVDVTVSYSSVTKAFAFYRNGEKVAHTMRETSGAGQVAASTAYHKYIGQSGYGGGLPTGALDDLILYNAVAGSSRLDAAAEALTLHDEKVYFDFALEKRGLYDSEISWSVKEPSEALQIEGNTAKIRRADEDVQVTLVASLQLDGGEKTKEFPLTVAAKVRGDSAGKAVTFNNVSVQDGFWTDKQKHVICEMIESGITNIEKTTGGIPNLIAAARWNNGELTEKPIFQDSGTVWFLDSDPWKMMEAMSYAIQIDPRGDGDIIEHQNFFKEKLNEYIGYTQGAQEKYVDTEGNPVDDIGLDQYDGYLDTYYTLDNTENLNLRFDDFSMSHELYVAGHFYEAAVAYTRAMDYKDLRLLDVAVRNADMLSRLMGWGKWEVVPGHEEVELALVKLAAVCDEVGVIAGEEGYAHKPAYTDYQSRVVPFVNLAKFFIDKRGYGTNHGDNFNGQTYHQTHAPVVQQTEARGHAVRAMYLYSGMADVDVLIDGNVYDAPLQAIWEDLKTKTYVTGAIGTEGNGSDSEGFGPDYYLPVDNRIYGETCANIGTMMWSQRLNVLYGDAFYIDTLETALYNSVLSGGNFAGSSFFYQNPISSDGNEGRAAWYGVACCPPNLMRNIAALGGYIYTQNKSGISINMYIGNDADIDLSGNAIRLSLETQMPWYGTSKLTVKSVGREGESFAIRLRVPGWAKGDGTVKVNGVPVAADKDSQQQGYVVVTRAWTAGDVIDILFPMETEKYHDDPRVQETKGLAAVKRGPVVYAAESVDNPFGLTEGYLLGTEFEEEMVDNVIAGGDETPDPYNIKDGLIIKANGFTKDSFGTVTAQTWRLIPYYSWNNRGRLPMRVFVKDAEPSDLKTPIDITLTNKTAGGGTFGLSGQKAAIGGAVTVTAAPISGYMVGSLLVNGEDYTSEIRPDNTVTIRNIRQNLDIVGTFVPYEQPLEGMLTHLEQNATPTAHYTPAWEDVNLVKLLTTPPNSRPGAGNGWGDWDRAQRENVWIRYTWPDPVSLNTFDIYWYDDGGGTRVPTAMTIQYLDEENQWQNVSNMTPFNQVNRLNRYNVVDFNPVKTTAVRLNLTAQAPGTGILRWHVRNTAYSGILEALLKELENLSAEDYSNESYENFKAAREEAQEKLADSDSTDAILKEATEKLHAARLALRPVMTDLQLAIAAAETFASTVESGLFSDWSWADFMEAIENAKAILGFDYATAADVTKAIARLDTTKGGLQADKTGLTEAIEAAEALNPDEYTEASRTALAEVLDGVKAVAADPQSSPEAVAEAIWALNETVKSLVKRASVTWLDGKIEAAKEILEHDNPAKYQQIDWETFLEALDAALILRVDLSGKDDGTVYAAGSALQTAMDGLVEDNSRTELRELIEFAEEMLKTPEKYIPASVENLTNVVALAREVLADDEATAEDFQQAVLYLWQGIWQMYAPADKTELQMLCDVLSTYQEASFTPVSWAPFAGALAAADAALQDPNLVAGGGKLEKAISDLLTAERGLAKRGNSVGLAAAVAQAKAIMSKVNDYIPSTILSLSRLIAEAEQLMASGNASQQQLDARRDTLRNAIGAARLKPDRSPLLDALQGAKAINLSLYTARSAAPLQALIAKGETMLGTSDEKLDQGQINGLAAEIKTAVDGLIPREKTPAADQDKNESQKNSGGKTTAESSKSGPAAAAGKTGSEAAAKSPVATGGTEIAAKSPVATGGTGSATRYDGQERVSGAVQTGGQASAALPPQGAAVAVGTGKTAGTGTAPSDVTAPVQAGQEGPAGSAGEKAGATDPALRLLIIGTILLAAVAGSLLWRQRRKGRGRRDRFPDENVI